MSNVKLTPEAFSHEVDRLAPSDVQNLAVNLCAKDEAQPSKWALLMRWTCRACGAPRRIGVSDNIFATSIVDADTVQMVVGFMPHHERRCTEDREHLP